MYCTNHLQKGNLPPHINPGFGLSGQQTVFVMESSTWGVGVGRNI